MGRPIDVIFVTADGMECEGTVTGDDWGRPPAWWERVVHVPLPVTVAPRELPAVRERAHTRRYELQVWRRPSGGPDVWKYVEVSPQFYSDEIRDLRQRNAELAVTAGLLRRQIEQLGLVPTSTPSGG